MLTITLKLGTMGATFFPVDLSRVMQVRRRLTQTVWWQLKTMQEQLIQDKTSNGSAERDGIRSFLSCGPLVVGCPAPGRMNV